MPHVRNKIKGITLRTHKILWGRSGGKCAICKNDLIVSSSPLNDDPSIVGDEAHIVAQSDSFSRGDVNLLTAEERNQYSNLILLCKNHHKQVDDQPRCFTVDKLKEIKASHEKEVRLQLTGADRKQQRDELIYAGYVDYWEVKADLNEWSNISSWVNAPEGPCIPKGWYEDQKEFLIWIIGRIWPHRYLTFEKALLNYGLVLRDFINVFDKHRENERDARQDLVETQRFYKVEWNPERYKELSAEYEAHLALVCDLFFELTRAANYVCDRVRETIFPDYRMTEGALLIERHSVGYGLSTVRARLEYRGEERTELPYPGLDRFRNIRFTRDYAIAPDEPKREDFDF